MPLDACHARSLAVYPSTVTWQETDIKQCWSVEVVNEPKKLAENHEVLDKIAQVMAEYATVKFRVHGVTGGDKASNDPSSAPSKLAGYFGLRSRAKG